MKAGRKERNFLREDSKGKVLGMVLTFLKEMSEERKARWGALGWESFYTIPQIPGDHLRCNLGMCIIGANPKRQRRSSKFCWLPACFPAPSLVKGDRGVSSENRLSSETVTNHPHSCYHPIPGPGIMAGIIPMLFSLLNGKIHLLAWCAEFFFCLKNYKYLEIKWFGGLWGWSFFIIIGLKLPKVKIIWNPKGWGESVLWSSNVFFWRILELFGLEKPSKTIESKYGSRNSMFYPEFFILSSFPSGKKPQKPEGEQTPCPAFGLELMMPRTQIILTEVFERDVTP